MLRSQEDHEASWWMEDTFLSGKKVMKLILHTFLGHLPPTSHQQVHEENTCFNPKEM